MGAGGRVGGPEKPEQSGAGLWGGQEGPRPGPPEARSTKLRGLAEPGPWGPHCTLIHTSGTPCLLKTSGVARRWMGPGGSPAWRGNWPQLPVAHRPPGRHVGPNWASCPPAPGAGAECGDLGAEVRVQSPGGSWGGVPPPPGVHPPPTLLQD